MTNNLVETVSCIAVNGTKNFELSLQLTAIQKSTLNRLSELFLCGGNIEAADSKDFVAEIIDKYKSCDNLVYELNSISIALAELMYVREFKGKDATPININRFSFEIFNSGRAPQPESAITLAICILVEGIKNNALDEQTWHNIGQLEAVYHHALLVQSSIFAKVQNFKDDETNAYVDYEIHNAENEIREQIRVLLPQKDKQHRIKMHLTNWIKDNICTPSSDLKKYLNRLIAEERYLMDFRY